MSTMSLDVVAIHPNRRLRWRKVKQHLVEWRSRAELEKLSDRALQDIGMSRCTANFEASKPFWMA